tara:strand:+ start:1663 stop:1917 length:255 start_codon:yes stop_codon:yes gene_type:complete
MYREIKTELLEKAMIVMEDYVNPYWNSSNYRLNILDVICDNPKWTKRMIDFAKDCEEDELHIRSTIMHDIGGLMRKDEHFLPRI